MKSRSLWARKALTALLRRASSLIDVQIMELADQLSEAVFVVDPERNILFFNRRAEEITGFSRDEVIGRHCLTGIRCVRCLESCGVFTKGVVRDVPLELNRRDGGKAAIVKSASVIRDRAGQVIGAIEVFRLSPGERKICADDESPLLEDQTLRRLGTIMESLGRGVVVVDEHFVLEHVSSEFARMTGHDAVSLEGVAAATLLGDELCRQDSPFRRALEAGERREGWRATTRHIDGSTLGVSVTGAPLTTDVLCDGEAVEANHYVLVVRPDGHLAGANDRGGLLVFEGMVARSQAMKKIFQLIDLLKESDATVLIHGESGTGKELIASAIHARSARRHRPFVAVNCGALPAELLESELFGHVRGAFTGAIRDKPGRFEVVADGTILLDEIGDMPLPLQVKLLRVLQQRTFERVGETVSREVTARVVAATHQDLAMLVAEQRFREDLFYRLNVVPIRIPPLRERREDIEPLIFHLLDVIGRRRSRAFRLSPGVLRTLLAADWPGNVRQLENTLEYATTLCEGETVHVRDLPPEFSTGPVAAPRRSSSLATPAVSSSPKQELPTEASTPFALPPRGSSLSSSAISDALERSRYNRGDTAKLLGVSRTTLWRRMRRLGMM